MKLSFSTKGWHGRSFDEFLDIAKELRFSGIELHNVNNKLFTDTNSAFGDYSVASTLRKMYEKKLSIPCIDSICDFADENERESARTEISECIRIAKNLHIPYIRLHAKSEEGRGIEYAKEFLSELLPLAEKAGVTLLLETSGLFSDSKALRATLDSFACDALAALWDVYSSHFIGKEEPETTIENLGAYVRHIHIKDAKCEEGSLEYCLMGEGELPVSALIRALRSINYNEFISLEWSPEWCEEIDDIEIILSQFENFMSQYSDPSRADNSLYYNKAHTGRYIWKKDILIDCTFSQVLDRMVEEFPDHLAFKYTTLNYTRTYYEFRRDVDEFARSLISLGVKAGSHVAVWATNVPQWYIAFWAVTKIGAVLVSMNTAYKIHEAEYLLKQSDTHTLIMVDGYRDSNYSEIIAELCPELQTKKKEEPLHSKRLPFLRNVITVGFKQKGCMEWEDVVARSYMVTEDELARRAQAVDKDDVCNMQYTSGTTGFPKGVMLTHYNVVNNGKCIGDRMDLSNADRMMIQVPMFHCFGMVLAMTAAMTHGATLFPLPYYSPKPALSCINSERITVFHGVPTMFIALLEHEDFKKTDFSYMRTGIMAGSPCPISVMQEVVDKMNMKEITIVYGQTEASPGCTMSSTDDSIEVRVGTVGRALPEIECKIIDPETGEDCPDGVNGEFVARGYNIMKGYYKMP
ncbi:MAG: AMP-binding protein, partial [Clostridia bacterium]|nr:AMP-binding protein [Clostridia bacterium]